MESEKERRISGIAERLCLARKKKGLKQAELSLKTGLDRKTCFNIETDRVQGDIGLHTLERLARALNVSPAWLTFGDEDGEFRVADLLAQVAAEKQQRLDQATHMERLGFFGDGELKDENEEDWGKDEAGDDLDEAEDEDQQQRREDEEERHRRAKFPVWPHGYRPLAVWYPELLPMPRSYAPVLLALGPSQPRPQRVLAGQWLVSLVWEVDEASRRREAGRLQELLLSIVPERDRTAVEQVMRRLNSSDPATAGRMALELILDGGIPVSFNRLLMMRRKIPSSKERLISAAECVLEILENLLHPRRDDTRVLPPSVMRNAPLLAE